MSETREIKGRDLDEIYDFLMSAEVVEGPPKFREIVAKLWPELLHKVKPPVSEMHWDLSYVRTLHSQLHVGQIFND